MAIVVDYIIKVFNETINVFNEIINDIYLKLILKHSPATLGGMLIAYTCLVVMMLVPILLEYFHSKQSHVRNKVKKGLPDLVATIDVVKFGVIFYVVNFTVFIKILRIAKDEYKEKIFPEELKNLLVTSYYYILIVEALSNLLGNQFSTMLPKKIPKTQYKLRLTKGSGKDILNWINIKFNLHDVIFFILCATLGSFYIFIKHWIVNNIFVLIFAIVRIKREYFSNIRIGLFFLVILSFIIEMLIFDTNGMAIVNKSFHAPTKIIFPLDLLENGIFDANNFAVLSLGDIVIPGIFMAFLLRFDQSLKRKINIYFNASFLAYLLGLLAIVIEMCIYKTTQPTLSLLILVSCITSLLALIFGDFKALFSYEDFNIKKKKSPKKLNNIKLLKLFINFVFIP